jgi:2-polyprenyl-3-methyl-5-hydroxy-6-metoxy-1,4-benzoquinol methylase
MKADEKTTLYTRYITTHFGKIHLDKQDFGVHYKYFRKNYLEHLPQDRAAKILDIGCGMGHFLNFLISEGYTNYIGVDISEENIEFCKKNKFNVNQANIFSYLKDTSDTYDAIVMNDIIEHLEKPEILKLLNLILERLNPGGRLIIKAPNASNPIMASSSRYYDFTHELLFTEESMSQVLKISGFNQIKIYPQDLYVFYYNPLNYLAIFFNFMLNGIFHLMFQCYGRKTTKVFTKNLIAVAVKCQ